MGCSSSASVKDQDQDQESGSPAKNFFFVYHNFVEGKHEAWWKTITDGSVDFAEGAKKQYAAGFFNHAFLPSTDAMQGGTITCIWEAKSGTTKDQMQAFIDGPLGPSGHMPENVFVNTVHPVNSFGGALPLPNSAFDVENRFSPTPTQPPTSGKWWFVRHTIKEGKGDEWGALAQKRMTVQAEGEKLANACKEAGFNNPQGAFMPSAADPSAICCIWQGKPDSDNDAFQKFVDEVVGETLLTNVVFEIMPSAGSNPFPDSFSEVPEPVALFFDQKPSAGDKQEKMIANLDDDVEIVFKAAFGKPEMKLGKPQIKYALGALVGAFPDFTFKAADPSQQIYKESEVSWSMILSPDGNNTGEPFAPMPGLPPVEKTGKYVRMTVERFTLTVNEAKDKIVKIEIEKQIDGPSGPPGFYVTIGGKLPAPGAAPPASAPHIMVLLNLKEFAPWWEAFSAHKDGTTFKIGEKEYSAPLSRKDFADTENEEVFVDVDNGNNVLVSLPGAKPDKMAEFFSTEGFKALSEATIESQEPPNVMIDMPPGPPPADAPKPDVFVSFEVGDVEKWIAGFKAHGNSKTHESWEGEAVMTRSEICDEAKTRVFKSQTNPKRVAALIYSVDGAKMGEFMSSEHFQKMAQDLEQDASTQITKMFSPLPVPSES